MVGDKDCEVGRYCRCEGVEVEEGYEKRQSMVDEGSIKGAAIAFPRDVTLNELREETEFAL